MKKIAINTSLILLILIVISTLSHCKTEELDKKTYFNIKNTEITISNKSTIVNTTNTDFPNCKLYISRDIKIINKKIISKKDQKIWYIPFNKNEKPILLTKAPDDEVTIRCDCKPLSPGSCDVKETHNNSNNSSEFECEGGCLNDSVCKMTVIVKSKSKEINISSGIIIASEKVLFNNKEYN